MPPDPAMTAMTEGGRGMDHKAAGQIALHRWAVIAEAAGDKLTAQERGGSWSGRSPPAPARAPGRVVPARTRAARSTGGCGRGAGAGWTALQARRRGPIPAWCAPTRSCSPRPPRCGWNCPAARPRRSPRSCITGTGSRVSERTVRGQLRRAGLHREALAAEPKAYGRYEAARPNERWITDVLVGPWVPWPRRDGSVRARLFLIVDDHSRLLVDGRFYRAGRTPAPARTCCAGRSPAAACPRCSMRIMPRLTLSRRT